MKGLLMCAAIVFILLLFLAYAELLTAENMLPVLLMITTIVAAAIGINHINKMMRV